MKNREYDKEKSTLIRFRASEIDKSKFQQYCKENNVDMSTVLLNYVRRAVQGTNNVKVSL